VTQTLGWRWTNWVVMCLAGVSWFLTLFIKESYGPALLQQRTKRKRQEMGDDRWWCRYDQRVTFWKMMRVNLSRPFVMAIFEPIWYVAVLLEGAYY